MEEQVLAIRPSQPSDLAFLWDMLWEAAAIDPGVRAVGKEVAFSIPQLRRYLEGWGRAGDIGVVARDEAGQPLGAAWARLFPREEPGYGFVASDIPELAIGVAPAFRGRGVGGALLDTLLETARVRGYEAVSLAVDRQNPALKLYERKGFRDAGISDPADRGLTMIVSL